VFQAVFIFAGFMILGLLSASATAGDTWGVVVNALLGAGLAVAVAVVGSRTLRPVLRPESSTRPAGASPTRVIAREPGSRPRSVQEPPWREQACGP